MDPSNIFTLVGFMKGNHQLETKKLQKLGVAT
jgi:hypothetical protein